MKLIANAELWEDGEYIVTINEDGRKSWESYPIGATLSKKDAETCAKWLNTSLGEILKIACNLVRDETTS